MRADKRSEHSVSITRKMLRRPATRRGVWGPHARTTDEKPQQYFSGAWSRLSARMYAVDTLSVIGSGASAPG